jgi:predicted nucleic acid-binding protein
LDDPLHLLSGVGAHRLRADVATHTHRERDRLCGTFVAPVYMDANVLVGALVSQHSLYQSCGLLLGEMLSAQVELVLTDLVLTEAFWALAEESYRDLRGPRAALDAWKMTTCRQFHERIFRERGAWMYAIDGLIRALDSVGYPLDVVRPNKTEWLAAMPQTHTLMENFKFTPNDSSHVAIAEIHAHTFVTADRGLRKLGSQQPTPPGQLTVVHVSAKAATSR